MSLDRVLTVVAVSCLAAWLGIMAFFSFVVAPLAFRTVERAVAGQIVSAALPPYYAWGLALGGVAGAALLARALAVAGRRAWQVIALGLVVVALGLLGWTRGVVLPETERARAARDDAAFARAHRAAVRLNGLTLAAGVLALGLEAFRPRGRARR